MPKQVANQSFKQCSTSKKEQALNGNLLEHAILIQYSFGASGMHASCSNYYSLIALSVHCSSTELRGFPKRNRVYIEAGKYRFAVA
jgi:hypothetical protein